MRMMTKTISKGKCSTPNNKSNNNKASSASSAPQSKSKSESDASPSGVITQALQQKQQQPQQQRFLFDDEDDYSNSFDDDDDDDDDHDSFDDDDDLESESEVLSLISVSGFVAEAMVDEVIRIGRSVVGVGQCHDNDNTTNHSRIPGRGKRLEFVFDENDRVVDLAFFKQEPLSSSSPPPPPSAPKLGGTISNANNKRRTHRYDKTTDFDFDIDNDDDDEVDFPDPGDVLLINSSGLDGTLDKIEYFARNNSFVSSFMGVEDENEIENLEIEIENDENDIAVARVRTFTSRSEKINVNSNRSVRSNRSEIDNVDDGNRYDDADDDAVDDDDLSETLSTMGTIFTDFMQQQEELGTTASDDDDDDDVFDDVSEESSFSNNSVNLSLLNEDLIKTIEDVVVNSATNVTTSPNDCDDVNNSLQQYYDNKEVVYNNPTNDNIDTTTTNLQRIYSCSDQRTTSKLGFFKKSLSSISGCSSKSSTNVLLMNNKRMMSSRRQEEEEEEEDGIIFHDEDDTRIMNDMYVDIVPVLKQISITNKRKVNNNSNNNTQPQANQHQLERELPEKSSSTGSSDRRGRRNNQDQGIVYNRETFATSTTTASPPTNNASSSADAVVINNKNVGNTSYEYHYDNKEVVYESSSVVKNVVKAVNNDNDEFNIDSNHQKRFDPTPINKTRTSFGIRSLGRIRSTIMSKSSRHQDQEDDCRNRQHNQDEETALAEATAATMKEISHQTDHYDIEDTNNNYTNVDNDGGSAVGPTSKKITGSNIKRSNNSRKNTSSKRCDPEAFNNTKKKIVTSASAKTVNTTNSTAVSSKKLATSKIKKSSSKGSGVEVCINLNGINTTPTTAVKSTNKVVHSNTNKNVESNRINIAATNDSKVVTTSGLAVISTKIIIGGNFKKSGNKENVESNREVITAPIKSKGSGLALRPMRNVATNSAKKVNISNNESEVSNHNVISTSKIVRKQKDDSNCKNHQEKKCILNPEATADSSVAITKSAHDRINANSDHRSERRNWFGRGAKKQKSTKDEKCEKDPQDESIKRSVTDQNRTKKGVMSEWKKQKNKTQNVTQSAEVLPSSHNDDSNEDQVQDCVEAVLPTPVTNGSWFGNRIRMNNHIGRRQQKRHDSTTTEAAPLNHDTDHSSSAFVGGCEISQQKQQMGSSKTSQPANDGRSNRKFFGPQKLLCGFDKLHTEEEMKKMIPNETKDSILAGHKSQYLQNFKQRTNRGFTLTTADRRTDRKENSTVVPLQESLRKKNFENDSSVDTATSEETAMVTNSITQPHQLGTSKAPQKKRDGTNNGKDFTTLLRRSSSSAYIVQSVDNEDDLTKRWGNVRIGVDEANNDNEKDLNSMGNYTKIRVEETKNEPTILTPSPTSQGPPPSADDQANHGKDMAEFLMKVSSFVDDYFVDAKRDPATIKSIRANATCEVLNKENSLHLDRLYDKKHDVNVGANVASTGKILDVVYIPTSKMKNRTKKEKKSMERRPERQHSQNNDEPQLDDRDSFPILGKYTVVPTRSKDPQVEVQHSKKMNDESRTYPDEQGRSLDDDVDSNDDSFSLLESLPFRAVVPKRQSSSSHEILTQQTKEIGLPQTTRDEWVRSMYSDEDSAFQPTGSLPFRVITSTSSKQPSDNLTIMKEEPPHSGLEQNIIIDNDEHSIESLPYRVTTTSNRFDKKVAPFPLNWEDNHKNSSSIHRKSLPNDDIVDDNEKHNRTVRKVTNNREQKVIPPKVLLLQHKKIEPPGSDQFLSGDNSKSKNSSSSSDQYVVDENGFIVDNTIAVLEDLEKSSTNRHSKPPPTSPPSWKNLEKKQIAVKEERQIIMMDPDVDNRTKNDYIPTSSTTTTATATTVPPIGKLCPNQNLRKRQKIEYDSVTVV